RWYWCAAHGKGCLVVLWNVGRNSVLRSAYLTSRVRAGYGAGRVRAIHERGTILFERDANPFIRSGVRTVSERVGTGNGGVPVVAYRGYRTRDVRGERPAQTQSGKVLVTSFIVKVAVRRVIVM